MDESAGEISSTDKAAACLKAEHLLRLVRLRAEAWAGWRGQTVWLPMGMTFLTLRNAQCCGLVSLPQENFITKEEIGSDPAT